MKKMTISMTIEQEVHPIMVPNYILVGEERKPVAINQFSQEQILELCQAFKEEMLKKWSKD